MWMMMVGYGGDYGSKFNESAGSFNGRKLRPLMPRPTGSISSSKKTFSPMPNPNSSYCTRIHKANLTTLNANLGTIKDQTKLDTSTAAVPLVTTRWCPTPEQLHALKEMYRHGMQTPTAEQIHQIAARLRRFGKIEGKNVFYWFQNHKARARQRHRRMLIGTPCEERLCNTLTLGRKKSGLSATGHEITLKKNKATSSSCSTLSEDSVSIPRTAASEKGTDGWIQLHMDRELQLTMKRSTETVQPNWQLMNPYSTPPIHSVHTITSAENTPEALGINISDGQRRDIQTLQLFPIHSDDRSAHYMETEVQPMAAMDTSFGPNQSFEFLLMKRRVNI